MSDSAVAQMQKEIIRYNELIKALIDRALSGDGSVTVVDIQKEVNAHRQRVDRIMEAWQRSMGL